LWVRLRYDDAAIGPAVKTINPINHGKMKR
jgi:hypothetical protein